MKQWVRASLLLLILVALWRVTIGPDSSVWPSPDTTRTEPAGGKVSEQVGTHRERTAPVERTWVQVALKHHAGISSTAVIAKLRESYREAMVEETPSGLIFNAYLTREETEWLRGLSEVYGLSSLDDYAIPN